MRPRPDTSTFPGSPARRRGVLGAIVVFGLFLALQVGASFGEHDHATVADGIECVACHGVRVAPPAERPMSSVEAPEIVTVLPSPPPEVPSRTVLALTGDPPRGPPRA